MRALSSVDLPTWALPLMMMVRLSCRLLFKKRAYQGVMRWSSTSRRRETFKTRWVSGLPPVRLPVATASSVAWSNWWVL